MRLTGRRGEPLGVAVRTGAALALGLAVALLAALWASGAFAALGHWALGQQRALQALLAGHLQAVRAGEPLALWSLMGLAASYGFLHALGPGHGKVLVAGAALGTRATARRMIGIALAGSLAQALVAIGVVYGAFALFTATARGTVETSDAWLEPIGHLAVAAIGAWLVARGLRAAGAAPDEALGHDHAVARACGHAHAPDAAAVAGATGTREAAALVAAMAVRPCTGALVVLVLAWRFDIAVAGAGAVLAMGLGTAAFTMLVAGLAVGGREAAFLSTGGGAAARRLAAGLQIAAGSLILVVGGLLLAAALGLA
jgi:nickel/cobalt transporter (NicO) family protein